MQKGWVGKVAAHSAVEVQLPPWGKQCRPLGQSLSPAHCPQKFRQSVQPICVSQRGCQLGQSLERRQGAQSGGSRVSWQNGKAPPQFESVGQPFVQIPVLEQ